MKSENILVFDVETSTFNKGHPFDPRNYLVSYAYASNDDISFRYYSDPDFASDLYNKLGNADVVIGFNAKFDLHWCRRIFGKIPDVKVWDCQLADFVYEGQEGRYSSLNEVCEKYGLPTKIDLVKDHWERGISTEDIPLHIIEEYNKWDVYLTKLCFEMQQNMLSDKQKKLVYLLGEDLKALQDAEFNGVLFDTKRALEKLDTFREDVFRINSDIYRYLPDGIPNGTFNLDSGDHLSALLYGGNISFSYSTEEDAVYKSGDKKGIPYTRRRWFSTEVSFPQRFKPLEGTEVKKTADNPEAVTRFYQVDAPTLQQLKSRRAEDRALLELLKLRSTKIKVVEMIESVLNTMETKNWKDNLMHGQFNQNVVVTGRLSSSAPNMQNFGEELDELIISRYAH